MCGAGGVDIVSFLVQNVPAGCKHGVYQHATNAAYTLHVRPAFHENNNKYVTGKIVTENTKNMDAAEVAQIKK